MKNFEHNYLVFDEFGLKEILCMSCGAPIKSRAEVKSTLVPSGVIREIAKHADYREVPVKLSDGNIAFLMVCDSCKFVEVKEEEAVSITDQLKNALRCQLEWEGKPQEIIDEILNKTKRQVLRKAEPEEVVGAMRGLI